MKKLLSIVLSLTMLISTMGFTAFANTPAVTLPDVDVTVDSTTTWSAAINSATDINSDGIITYGVSGKVIVDVPQIKGAASDIYIIGLTDDAELVVECERGNIFIKNSAIRTVNFANLTLSRLNGSWVGDLDNTNKFFAVWTYTSSATNVNYTNCVFPQGAAAAYPGETTYTGCEFNNTTGSDYGLWIYAVGNTTVTDCTFNSNAGLKTYGYASQTNMNTVIENTEFNVSKKPAVVASGLGTIELNNVDVEDCPYGVWEVGVVGGKMATVTQDDVAPEYVATTTDKYGVTVYTTSVEHAANVSNEAAASGKDSVLKPLLAVIGGNRYFDLADVIEAAAADSTVELLADATVDATVVIDKNLTIDGNGFTLKGADYTDTVVDGVTPLHIKNADVKLVNINVVGGDAKKIGCDALGSAVELTNANLTVMDSTLATGEGTSDMVFGMPVINMVDEADGEQSTVSLENVTLYQFNGETWGNAPTITKATAGGFAKPATPVTVAGTLTVQRVVHRSGMFRLK